MIYVILISLILCGVLIGKSIQNTRYGVFLKKYRGPLVVLVSLIIMAWQYINNYAQLVVLPCILLLLVGLGYIVYDFKR